MFRNGCIVTQLNAKGITSDLIPAKIAALNIVDFNPAPPVPYG